MLALDNLFPQKFCINLQRRPDRWENMNRQFRAHDIHNVVRYDAVDGRSLIPHAEWKHGAGAYGCLLSHLEIVRKARDSDLPAVMIFEDDVIFHDDFGKLFEEYSAQVPGDWEAIVLGGIHMNDPVPVAPGVSRMTDAFSTYAYGLRKSAYETFLSDAEKLMRPVDHTTRSMQEDSRFYCFTPHLAWVAVDHSDIKNAAVNLWWLRDTIAMNGEKIRRMFARTLVVLRVPDDQWCAGNQEIVQCVTRIYGRMNLRFQFLPASRTDASTIEGLLDAGDEYVVIADADIFPFVWEFKASLLKCLEFDRVLPIHQAVPLDLDDTRLVIRTLINDVDTSRYEAAPTVPVRPDFCMMTRAALSMKEPRTFHSPSRLVRLHL
jgi:glycosyl transferase, family 25